MYWILVLRSSIHAIAGFTDVYFHTNTAVNSHAVERFDDIEEQPTSVIPTKRIREPPLHELRIREPPLHELKVGCKCTVEWSDKKMYSTTVLALGKIDVVMCTM